MESFRDELEGMGQADVIPPEIQAEIDFINSGAATVDRTVPQAVLDYNVTIEEAHRKIRDWIIAGENPLDEDFRRELISSLIGRQNYPGSQPEGNRGVTEGRRTHSIPPTVRGTGLSGQEKAPRYNEKGETT